MQLTHLVYCLLTTQSIMASMMKPAGGNVHPKFPAHWGDPPRIQTRDYRPWPGGYGAGSGTVAKWIQEKMDEDASTGNLGVGYCESGGSGCGGDRSGDSGIIRLSDAEKRHKRALSMKVRAGNASEDESAQLEALRTRNRLSKGRPPPPTPVVPGKKKGNARGGKVPKPTPGIGQKRGFDESLGHRGGATNTMQSWPELVGKTSAEAKKAIQASRPDIKVQTIPMGSMMTMDFRTDRVRIFVDSTGLVSRPPKFG